MTTSIQAVPEAHRPPRWHQQAAWVLDELKGAASLSLILAVALSLEGVSHGPWQWICLLGGPAWFALRAAKLL